MRKNEKCLYRIMLSTTSAGWYKRIKCSKVLLLKNTSSFLEIEKNKKLNQNKKEMRHFSCILLV